MKYTFNFTTKVEVDQPDGTEATFLVTGEAQMTFEDDDEFYSHYFKPLNFTYTTQDNYIVAPDDWWVEEHMNDPDEVFFSENYDTIMDLETRHAADIEDIKVMQQQMNDDYYREIGF